ncbi:MAG TPA: hypothetical protein VK737_05455 [Opitutales bacterium]|jgi:hypothetical protein|nr:hypothetical protein [Opitutales bacterium]
MAHTTEEIAQKILEALQDEQDCSPRNVRYRKPLGVLSKELMARYHWTELEFLQGWGLIQSEKLIDGQQLPEGFFAQPTEAGRDFIRDQQPGHSWELGKRELFFVVGLIFIVIRFAIILWKAR